MKSKLILGFAIMISSATFTQTPEVEYGSKSQNSSNSNLFRKSRFDFIVNKKITQNTRIIKFSPLQLFRGEIAWAYEEAIQERMSFEISVGPTLSNVNAFEPTHEFPFDPNVNQSPNVSGQSKVGFMGSASIKYYPIDNQTALHGFYVEQEFKYRVYNDLLVDQQDILEDRKGSINQARFSTIFGSQRWLSDNLSIDFFGGVGLNFSTSRTSFVLYSVDQQTFEESYEWEESVAKGVNYYITAGVKVGIGW
jgi:hypothetical protein